MDPLSITASVLTVAATASAATRAIAHLCTLHKTLPDRLHVLNNEVVDLELVFRRAASTVEKIKCLSNSSEIDLHATLNNA